MSNWKPYKIRDIINLEYGKALRNYQTDEGEFDVYGTNGKIGKTDKFLHDRPSIIIGRKGAYREVYFAKRPFFVIDTAFYTVNKIDNLDTTFLYYWFKNIDFNLMDSGSAIPSTSRDEVYDLDIELPDEEEQKNISSILSSLDDKITLLSLQNNALEKVAETCFNQWVCEESEESWDKKSLDEIAEYLNGLALQKFPPKENDFLPVIKIREMKQGVSNISDKCSRDIPNRYIVQGGDILFSWSGSLEVIIWNNGEGALNQHIFKVSSEIYPKWFYYLATKYHLETFRMIAESKSTTMGHIQREHLSEAKISIPPPSLFDEFDGQIRPLIEKIIGNNSQINTLSKLRDTLLPKLVSGELKVKG